MTKSIKVTRLIASALADNAFSEIEKTVRSTKKDLENKVASDPIAKRAKALCKKEKEISREIGKIREQLRQKYKLSEVYIYEDSLSVRHRGENILPTKTEIVSAIILANQVDGVPYEKLVDYAVKKFAS
jgi:hypothetical protein